LKGQHFYDRPRGYFRGENCVNGESTAAPRLNYFFVKRKVEHEDRQAASSVFQVFGMTRLGIEPSLAAFVARAQPTVPLRPGFLNLLAMAH